MQRILAGGLLALLIVIGLPPGTAFAQPACNADAFAQADMAGLYISEGSPMRVQMFPCGGTHVLWDNQYGRHSASYTAKQRMPGGGVLAVGLQPDPAVGYLDNAYTIAFAPAEVGFIEVITASPYGQIVGIYRLRKIQ